MKLMPIIHSLTNWVSTKVFHDRSNIFRHDRKTIISNRGCHKKQSLSIVYICITSFFFLMHHQTQYSTYEKPYFVGVSAVFIVAKGGESDWAFVKSRIVETAGIGEANKCNGAHVRRHTLINS